MSEQTQGVIDFSQIISDRFIQLTKSEKRIANYVRKNQEEAAFLSAGELADRLGLSEATLVRFARTLGFPSYPAMRNVLQDNFRRRVTHSARLRGRLMAEPLSGLGGSLPETGTLSVMSYSPGATPVILNEPSDCTGAKPHLQHAPLLKAAGKVAIDLTPAAVGPYLVPAVCCDIGDPMNVNLVTCGGQGVIPMVYAVSRIAPVREWVPASW